MYINLMFLNFDAILKKNKYYKIIFNTAKILEAKNS